MPKSKEKIMLDLDSLEIGYDSKQPYVELAALLKRKQEEIEAKNVVVQETPERDQISPPVPAKDVRLGLSTILDHEARIAALEGFLSAAKAGKVG